MHNISQVAWKVAWPRLLVIALRNPRRDISSSHVRESLSPLRSQGFGAARVLSTLTETHASLTSRMILAILTLSCVLALGTDLGAHAILAGSDPRHGAVLDESPPRVLFRFNAALEHTVTRVNLVDVSKTRTPLRRVESRLDRVVVELPPLAPGVYTVVYRVLARDGHVTEGFIRFTIRDQ